MDRKTGLRKEMFMQVAPYLTDEEILNLRSLSVKMSTWGFEYLATNQKFDLEKSSDSWSLIIEEKLKMYTRND